jgi:hypothetical protein
MFQWRLVISLHFAWLPRLEENFIYIQGYCSNVTSKCVCSSGYGGLMCELDINECAANDRICGSFTCTNLPGDYKCDCDFFHSGKRCQNSKLILTKESSFFFVRQLVELVYLW